MGNNTTQTLIIQTAFLGDLLLSVPLLRKARELWPEDRLVLMCREKLGEFFLRTGLVDEIIEIRKKDGASYQRAQEHFKNKNLVRVISPHLSFRTAWFVRRLKAADKITFAKPWNFFAFNRRLARPDVLPDALRQLSLLSPFDGNLAENLRQYAASGRAYRRDENGQLSGVPPWASTSLRDGLLKDRNSWIRLMEKLNWQHHSRTPKVLVFPGSVWATKRWTEEGFIEVGRRLTEKGAQVFIMGAGNEVPLAERVAARIPGSVSLAGHTSLYESALVLVHSDLMIGNDSASIHLASCTETPLIAIFGPTVLEFGFRPWSNQAWVADRQGLSCRPCGPHGHNKCPRGTHECMKNISPEEILKIDPLNFA